MTIQVGDPAPEFTLPDQNGEQHSLSEYRGHWVLIYFYPKDDTPGCTKEACAIRDNFPQFGQLDARVLGISIDSVASHKKFEQKYELPFTLLADEDKNVVRLYEVWGLKKSFGREYQGTKRMSYLVNPEGQIAKIYKSVKPKAHAQQVLGDIQALKAGGS